MKNFVLILLLAAILLATATGCYTFDHRVGKGGSGQYAKKEGAWFILWGLIPLNTVDSKTMAGSASDYTVTTEFTFLDVVISFFTGIVTIHKQTVAVET